MKSPSPFEFAVAPPDEAGSLHVFRTRAGWAAVLARGDVLCRVVLPMPSREDLLAGMALAGAAPKPTPPPKALGPAVSAVIDYYAGRLVDPAAVAVRFDPGPISEFARRVYGALRLVPRGRTTTYGELAVAAGRPGAARAVGVAMSKNRFPLFIPCHRVLASGGKLGGFSSPGGISDKKRMLLLERG